MNVQYLLPPKPLKSGATGLPEARNLFFSLEEGIIGDAPAPVAVFKWAQQEFDRAFAPATPAPVAGFDGYRSASPLPQNADQLKTGWVSAKFAVREGNTVVINASELNVRAGPSTDHSAITKARAGQRLPFVSERDGWFEVSLPSDGQTQGGSAFCKITMVKGTTPYLVQMDSFLRPKEVFLTFDDGPMAKDDRTLGIMQDLKAANMPASFFMLGSTIQQASLHPLLQTMGKLGHNPAVHGFYHATSDGKPFTAIPWTTVQKHLSDNKNLIKTITGTTPILFRPPYGIIRAEDLKMIQTDLQLIPLGWTVDSLDWSIKSADELYTKLPGLIQQRGKGIVLMHDIDPQSRLVVPRLVNWLKQNGYTVVGPERIMEGFAASQK